jgi:hypothetical protein
MSADETEHSQNQPPDDSGRDDCFAPPAEPCECYCLHCQRVFMSDGMWFQKVINAKDDFKGFWMCPTPNCDGAGFTFDIFPTDPDHPANSGWYDEDDSFEEEDGEEFQTEADYDPAEPRYAELDEVYGEEDDDDIEGEEWKHGLEPGERPPEPPWVAEARQRWEEEQSRYDGPDERPRFRDWSDQPDPPPPSSIGEDDIPF